MGLFGKPKMHEEYAAAQFVIAMLEAVRENWIELTASFRSSIRDTKHFDSVWGQFEFGIAVVATQFQAVPNLLPADQAQRLRRHVVNFLNAPDFGESAVAGFEAYDAAFKTAVKTNEHPFGALTATFCYRLEIEPPNALGIISPLFVLAVGNAIALAFPGWWKNLLDSNRLVQ